VKDGGHKGRCIETMLELFEKTCSFRAEAPEKEAEREALGEVRDWNRCLRSKGKRGE
jgi:hypothetical protein